MNDRKGFGSNFGFLMAAVGSAVGLGNIWGFPNKMGANGGFPFLILYLALALCCGVIIMLGELALGRKTGHGAVGAYQSISKRFKWLGWLGIAAAALIFSFYSALGYPSANVINDLGSQGICLSAGSACHRGKASRGYAALGLDKRTAAGVLRLSFGPETTEGDIDALYEALLRHKNTRFSML